jgi:ribonuclease-3 family protein
LQLAWLGDAIWELHQRLHHCRLPAQSKDLHQAVVASVRADAHPPTMPKHHPSASKSPIAAVVPQRS